MADPVLLPFYRLVEQHTGIHLDANKQYLVESRLAPLAQQQGETVLGLLQTLLRTPVGPLHQRAFEALATHETQFFRDRAFFNALAEHLIPALLARTRQHKALRICCAGVSTGQEAYSLAILLQEHFPELQGWDVFIQATDISNAALDKARTGLYSTVEVQRGLDAHLVHKYFEKVGTQRYQVRPQMRSRVNFSQANLLETPPNYPKFDLILLRNVLIYFLQDTKTRVLNHLRRQLHQPDGVLALGATESIGDIVAFKGVQFGPLRCYTHA